MPWWPGELPLLSPHWVSPRAWPGILGAQNQLGHSLGRCWCLQASEFAWTGDHLGAPAPLFSALDAQLTSPAQGSRGSLYVLGCLWTPSPDLWSFAYMPIPVGSHLASPVPVTGSPVSGVSAWPPKPRAGEGEARPPSAPLLSSGCSPAPCINATFVFVLWLWPLPGDIAEWELWLGSGEPGSAPAASPLPPQPWGPERSLPLTVWWVRVVLHDPGSLWPWHSWAFPQIHA